MAGQMSTIAGSTYAQEETPAALYNRIAVVLEQIMFDRARAKMLGAAAAMENQKRLFDTNLAMAAYETRQAERGDERARTEAQRLKWHLEADINMTVHLLKEHGKAVVHLGELKKFARARKVAERKNIVENKEKELRDIVEAKLGSRSPSESGEANNDETQEGK